MGPQVVGKAFSCDTHFADGIFPEFPRDDELERNVAQLGHTINEIQQRLTPASHAVHLLSQGAEFGQRACKSMEEALNYSSWDVMGGGTYVDMMERNALSQAGSHASQANMMLQQARNADPQIKQIRGLEAPNM